MYMREQSCTEGHMRYRSPLWHFGLRVFNHLLSLETLLILGEGRGTQRTHVYAFDISLSPCAFTGLSHLAFSGSLFHAYSIFRRYSNNGKR